MKKLLIYFFMGVLIVGTVYWEQLVKTGYLKNLFQAPFEELHAENEKLSTVEKSKEPKRITFSVQVIEGKEYISLSSIDQELEGKLTVDLIEGTAELRMDEHTIKLIKDTPSVEMNGIYLPNEQKIRFVDNEVLVPASLLNICFNFELIEKTETRFIVSKQQESVQAMGSNASEAQLDLSTLLAEDVIKHLSFLQIPIDGASVSHKPSHLPGAPRPYRSGVHEGIDWYSGTTGIEITEKTPVKSMGDGIVVRTDLDYVEYTFEKRQNDLMISAQMSHTPAFILDKLRGRSVWVQYEHGVMVRYAHLSRIETGIRTGSKVRTGDIIGYVGNSGTSFGVEGTSGGLHLHSDILIYGELFWEYLTPEQLSYVLAELFPKQ